MFRNILANLARLRCHTHLDVTLLLITVGTFAADKPTAARSKNKPLKPADLPAGLEVVEAPRNWGDSFLPKSKPPVRQVVAVSLTGLKTDERVALSCLQGLLAREQPRLWLIRNREDPFWMDWHQAKGHVDRFETVANWSALFQQFGGQVKGAVIPDAQLFRGDLLAVNVAACEDLIVASPQLAERLGLVVKLDLRGRFKTYAEGLAWLWANYKNTLNPHLCDFRHPGLLAQGTFDYSYQWRALMFWVAGYDEESKPGVDRLAEHRLVAKILSGMPVFRAVTSWRYGKEGFLREIREQVGAQRPAFVNGFVHCWTFTMDDLARIYGQRDSDMVFVTPSQLAQLYREAKAKGW